MKFKIRTYLLLIVAFITMIIVGCFLKQDNNSFSKKVEDKNNIGYLPISREVPNISIALLDESGKVNSNTNYYLNSGERFEKFINIGNFIDLKREFKLITFIDYEKREFYVDDKLVNDFNFLLDKQEDIQIPIKLPELSKGLHDIIFAIVKEPNDDLDEQYRRDTEEFHTLYIRFNLTVESEEYNKPSFNFTELTYNNDSAIPEIFLHENKNELKQLPLIKTKEDKLNLYMTVGNISNSEVKEYVIILLKDWEIINNSLNNEDKLFLKVNPMEKTTIPLTIDISESGLHNINAILIENPYQKIKFGSVKIINSIRAGVIKE